MTLVAGGPGVGVCAGYAAFFYDGVNAGVVIHGMKLCALAASGLTTFELCTSSTMCLVSHLKEQTETWLREMEMRNAEIHKKRRRDASEAWEARTRARKDAHAEIKQLLMEVSGNLIHECCFGCFLRWFTQLT